MMCAETSKNPLVLNSHLVTVPRGVLVTDVLFASPIIHGEEVGGLAGAAEVRGQGAHGSAGANADYGGIDPNMDPELALV